MEHLFLQLIETRILLLVSELHGIQLDSMSILSLEQNSPFSITPYPNWRHLIVFTRHHQSCNYAPASAEAKIFFHSITARLPRN